VIRSTKRSTAGPQQVMSPGKPAPDQEYRCTSWLRWPGTEPGRVKNASRVDERRPGMATRERWPQRLVRRHTTNSTRRQSGRQTAATTVQSAPVGRDGVQKSVIPSVLQQVASSPTGSAGRKIAIRHREDHDDLGAATTITKNARLPVHVSVHAREADEGQVATRSASRRSHEYDDGVEAASTHPADHEQDSRTAHVGMGS